MCVLATDFKFNCLARSSSDSIDFRPVSIDPIINNGLFELRQCHSGALSLKASISWANNDSPDQDIFVFRKVPQCSGMFHVPSSIYVIIASFANIFIANIFAKV